MSQLGIFDQPAAELPSKPKVQFIEGILATWFETVNGRPPKQGERVTLKAGAEQCVAAFQAALLLESSD